MITEKAKAVAAVVNAKQAFITENYKLSMYLYNKFYKSMGENFDFEEYKTYWDEGYLYAVYEWFTQEDLAEKYAFGTIVYTCGKSKCLTALQELNRKKCVPQSALVYLDAPIDNSDDEKNISIGACIGTDEQLEETTINNAYMSTIYNCIETYGLLHFTNKQNIVLYYMLYARNLAQVNQIFKCTPMAVYASAERIRVRIRHRFPKLLEDIHCDEITTSLRKFYRELRVINEDEYDAIVCDLCNGRTVKEIAVTRGLLFKQVYSIACETGMLYTMCLENK